MLKSENEISKKGYDFRHLLNFRIGFEVERHRVNLAGEISTFPYPKGIGNEVENAWITTDFMETMTEVVTPVAQTAEQAFVALDKISNVLKASLAEEELLWPLSMPPTLPKNLADIDIAHTTAEKRAYFINWVQRHNFQRATPTGVHINLGLNLQFIESNDLSRDEINELYMKVARGFMKNRYVLTYFFGASPIAEENYFLESQHAVNFVRSIRQSKLGFGTRYPGDYSSVEKYVAKILNGIRTGELFADNDFHAPVRLRGTQDLNHLASEGIDHIELRVLDFDPWSRDGISADAVHLIRLMAAYFIEYEEGPFNLTQADQVNEEVSLSSPTDKLHRGKMWSFIDDLKKFAYQIQAGQVFYDVLNRLTSQLQNPENTISARLIANIKNGSLNDFALNQATLNKMETPKIQTIKSVFEDSDGRVNSDDLKAHLF
ncbi:glutamate--cysteine ligase [Weissella coleopterorum]|uniref:Glutamate--cysteine ligase n=1 Tax=Weissella coleopterorum TaxID=2714949 RepID=A0A6G8AZD7_9LACO|nr:glutamate--cysteine ligase [Weissella coleopterorum]QIL50329.1 glutamate--cysteine ligase [Weissella coleopterorum]